MFTACFLQLSIGQKAITAGLIQYLSGSIEEWTLQLKHTIMSYYNVSWRKEEIIICGLQFNMTSFLNGKLPCTIPHSNPGRQGSIST